ncbi:hypothetical protein QBC34DRAFT_453141 [Podospora aff. communis PSN243]|uniref:Transporter n=1 Tax=Podospora aff. communis PSN243 TaxID=3040156 RepID=A0AAV9FZF4_9PEZI|nr:hypothetical protein QBC34DRAFT_453141 [Podospora aff. communis PSN243]
MRVCHLNFSLATLIFTLTLAQAFNFYQTHNGRTLDSIPESQFLASPFRDLCPSTNCFRDCLNSTRLFQSIPDNITSTPIKKFFTIEKEIVGVTDIFRRVALGVTACVADTCSQTRHPEKCSGACNLRSLLENDVREVDWEGGMLECVRGLCGSARVLPYANQDVLGIGVLISYYIQGILLLIAAAVVIALAGRVWLRAGDDVNSSVVRKLESPMGTFLTAETYFSISTAIAALIMSPRTIDPLNGYALLVIAVVGFLCPVFTLLLLRCLNVARVTRFGMGLTVISWLLNTVVFFLLLPKLLTFGDSVAEDALKQLFSIPTCGDSSAMSLCQQLTGNNPLRSLTGFFERSSWTNIRTVPVVWVLATAILLVMVAEQAWVLIVLCSVALGYTFHMVMRFRDVNAIDINGWSFGQVVAAIFWVPVFLDVVHSMTSNDTPSVTDP